MSQILSFIVFFSSIGLALCLWNDHEYTNKFAGILIFAYMSYLINNEYEKNGN